MNIQIYIYKYIYIYIYIIFELVSSYYIDVYINMYLFTNHSIYIQTKRRRRAGFSGGALPAIGGACSRHTPHQAPRNLRPKP